ncbi:MAG: LapA family protein [Syntrophaceae bacterium]|nr:LapA family protein [Deltaproteobacteria bacterium]
MKYLKVSILFGLAIVGVLFGISNQQSSTVHFFWYFSKSYPLYLVLFASFLAGTLVALGYGIMSGGAMKDEERRLNRRIDDLKGRIRQAGNSQPPGSTNGRPGLF